MSNVTAVLTSFVLEKLESEPLARRVTIYRALAALTRTGQERDTYAKLADDCEAIAATHDQLVLNFQRRARG